MDGRLERLLHRHRAWVLLQTLVARAAVRKQQRDLRGRQRRCVAATQAADWPEAGRSLGYGIALREASGVPAWPKTIVCSTSSAALRLALGLDGSGWCCLLPLPPLPSTPAAAASSRRRFLAFEGMLSSGSPGRALGEVQAARARACVTGITNQRTLLRASALKAVGARSWRSLSGGVSKVRISKG